MHDDKEEEEGSHDHFSVDDKRFMRVALAAAQEAYDTGNNVVNSNCIIPNISR